MTDEKDIPESRPSEPLTVREVVSRLVLPTPIFCCGAECGNVGAESKHFVATGANATISTTTVRNGARSFHINPTGAGSYFTAQIPSSIRLVGRLYVRFTTLPTGDMRFISLGGGNGPCIRYVASTQRLYAAVAATTSGVGIPIATGLNWWRLDFDFNIDIAGNDTCDLRINGVADTQAAAAGFAAGQTFLQIGSASVNTVDLYVDDILLSNTASDYPIGDGHVHAFIPTSDTQHVTTGGTTFSRTLTGTPITPSTTDAYQLIDDLPLDSGAGVDWVRMAAPWTANDFVSFKIGPAASVPTPSYPPRAVQVIFGMHASSNVAGVSFGIYIIDNAASDAILFTTNDSLPTTVVYLHKQYADPPSAASRWHVRNDASDGDFRNLRVMLYQPVTQPAGRPDVYLDSVLIEAEFADTGNGELFDVGAGTDSFSATPLPTQSEQFNISFANPTGGTLSGSLNENFTKTAGDAWGNAGCGSNFAVAGSTTPSELVLLTPSPFNVYRIEGWMNSNTPFDLPHIVTGIYLVGLSVVVYEGGQISATTRTYANKDIIRIKLELIGGVRYAVYYYNDVFWYQGAARNEANLYAGGVVYSTGVSIGQFYRAHGDALFVTASQPAITDSSAGIESRSVFANLNPLVETGAGTDSFSVAPNVTRSIVGAGVEAISILANVTIAESGAGVDVTDISFIAIVNKTIAETGAGTDSFSIFETTDKIIGDIDAGLEDQFILGILDSLSEVGAGSDLHSLLALLPALGDTGAGSESFTNAPTVIIFENGAGIDQSSTQVSITIAESGAGVDVAGRVLSLMMSETSAGIEGISINVSVSMNESGAGTDTFAKVDETANERLIEQTGAGVENFSIQASFTLTNVGAGFDSISSQALQLVNESGAGSEAVGALLLVLTVQNSAGLDAFSLQVAITLAESGAGTETMGTASTIVAGEVGAGSEGISVLAFVTLTDAGAGQDAFTFSAVVTQAQSGAGFENVTLFAAQQIDEQGAGDTQHLGFNLTLGIRCMNIYKGSASLIQVYSGGTSLVTTYKGGTTLYQKEQNA